jgi:hypothetical protein
MEIIRERMPPSAAACIGEEWVYYPLGSAVEVVPLVVIVRTAWTWPRTQVAPPLR